MIDHYGALLTRSSVRNLSKVSVTPRSPGVLSTPPISAGCLSEASRETLAINEHRPAIGLLGMIS